jgi:PPP family 3-phenylpropionic acid transporter
MSNFRLLTLISAVAFVAVGVTSPLVSLYLQSLGASYQEISLILTSVVAVSLVASYLWGRLSDRLKRRKPVLIAGLFLLALAFLLLSRAANPTFAWASRILEGIGAAAFSTLSLTMMGDLLESHTNRGRSMGVFRGIGSFAFAIGAVVGGRIADAYSLSSVFVLCAILYVIAGLAALALKEQPPRLAPTESPALVQPTRKVRELPIFFLIGVFLWMAAHMGSTSMWPNYMNSLGYTKSAIGSLWGLAAFIEMPAMYLAGMASDVVGRAMVMAAGGFLIALVQVGYLTLAGILPALLGVQVIRGFGYASYTATAMTYTAEIGAQQTRGRRSGVFNTVGSAGQLMGLLMGGTIVQVLGFSALYVVCMVLALGSAFCFLALRQNQTKPQPAETNV